MKFIIRLAFQNLTRYKRRTIITSFAIAIGLMLFIFVDSMLQGAEKESELNLKRYETGYLRVLHDEYWENRLMRPLDLSIEDPDSILADLESAGYRATKRITFTADMILNSADFPEEGNLSVFVQAVDVERDNEVFNFGETLVEGRFARKGADEVVIGSWFAEDIMAEVGYYISLITRGNGGFYEVMDLEIVGIVNCPNPNVNRTLLMMPFDTADYYLGMDGAATEIDIALSERSNLESEAENVARIVSGYSVLTWRDLARDYLALAEAKRGGTGTILFLVFIIAAVGISNTMLMAMWERTRELGMMRSLGMKDSSIRLAFIIEAGGIGLIGAVIGTALGCLANLWLVTYGIDFGFITRDMDIGYRVATVMKGIWSVKTIVTSLVSGVLLSMIVAYLPTRKALKMDIPSCLHHQ
ncbi:MAG: ABC transporter permease [Sphaerochaetaceae bacterium]|nr:ABC transporter permease [Sphaerochaetaceae bacterium]